MASLFLLEAFKGGGKGDGLAPNIEEPELWTVSDSDKLNDGKVIFSKLWFYRSYSILFSVDVESVQSADSFISFPLSSWLLNESLKYE